MNILLAALLLTFEPVSPIAETSLVDSIITVPDIVVSSPFKQQGFMFDQPVSGNSFSLTRIERERITAPKDLSLSVSNLYIPDYGSKMTSTIYIRGLGARMEQPAMGLYIDNVPVLNKNNYDFDFFDISQIDVLRGPQGTLYGRNTIGGILNIYTLSPFDFQGSRFSFGYGNGNSIESKAAAYHKFSDNLAFSISAIHRSIDGFFTNEYNGEKADRIRSEGARARIIWRKNRVSVDNAFSLNIVEQNGFPYAYVDEQTGKAGKVNYNDPGTYDRLGIVNGTTIRYTADKFTVTSVSSYQFLDDKMAMDQDYLPVSYFTLRQNQIEHALTQEVVIRSNTAKKWQWLFGGFGFYRHMDMNAPVTFKRDGIDELILGSANAAIPIPNAAIMIQEDEFIIGSDFKLPAYGAAAFHQSTITLGQWVITAGLRFDYEHTSMKYDNSAEFNYRFSLTMPDFKPLTTAMKGRESRSYFEVLPRASVMRKIASGNIYATVARGYKAGGFNTQIFSDILQNQMMDDMMTDLGMAQRPGVVSYDVSTATSYKPEYSWNYEIGTHLKFLKDRLVVEGTLFYIDVTNQQITVFPPGESTGRLMSNAGKTRSYGAEASVYYSAGDFRFGANYGHTNARFREYIDGDNDYKGNYLLYIPQNTISVRGEYSLKFNSDAFRRLVFNINWQGASKMYWNEDNSLSQNFYGMLGAGIDMHMRTWSISFWGKNITDKKYNTFYFQSIGNSFLQKGKPLQFGATVNITL